MTESLRALTRDKWPQHRIGFFTAPAGPASINNDHDGHASLPHCNKGLIESGLLAAYDCFVVACYSQHPLVPWLEDYFEKTGHPKKHVTGIFQASVWQSLRILSTSFSNAKRTFGIVSTGDYWDANLSHAVSIWENGQAVDSFRGVTTTGLSAKELHDLTRDQVALKMREATIRLLRRSAIGVICLGCAGMAGLDDIVREACVQELGHQEAQSIVVVDGCLAALAYFSSVSS